MNLKSRSDWLKFTRQCQTFQKNGRKRFNIHKNQHKVLIYPDYSPEKEELNQKRGARTPEIKKLSPNIRLSPIDESFYQRKLKEKESEIKMLKELCNDSTQKLLNAERVLVKPNRIKLNSEIFELSPRKELTPQIRKRNYLDLANHPAFYQPKFTKSRPKIILTNPITGITPDYIM